MSKNLPQCLKEKVVENTDKDIQRKYEQEVIAPVRVNYERQRIELNKQLKRCKDDHSDEADDLRKAIIHAQTNFDKQLSEAQQKMRFLLIILLATNGEKRRKKRVLPYPSRRKSIESEKKGRTIWSGNISLLSPRNKRARKKY